MTPDERRQLARTLAAIDLPHPLIDPRLRRRRRFGLLFMTACCLALAAWIAVLVLTLPERYTSHYWPAVWVGLDVAELTCFAATAWAAWHQRQILIFLMVVTGTLLVCDAWFDLALAYGSRGFVMSLLSALFVELPLAVLLFTSARRLVRVTIATMMQLSGIEGPAPPLWRIPLFADGLEEALPARLRPRTAQARARVASDVTAAGGSSSLGIRRIGRPEGRTMDTSQYAQYRPLMFSIAYRMTGSVSDAEDIVQEAFLRLTRVLRDGATIDSPKAYLATVTTRLAISHLRSARVRRESYVGSWLPEPLVGDAPGGLGGGPDPAERAEMSDSLSMAFLVLLESLTPTERAVFLLHEVFGHDEPAWVNGQPGAVSYDSEDRVVNVFTLDIADGRVQTVRSIVNPDKLRHLGPVSDVALRAPRDLTCRPWPPTSPRKPRPTRSWTASRRRRIPDCASC